MYLSLHESGISTHPYTHENRWNGEADNISYYCVNYAAGNQQSTNNNVYNGENSDHRHHYVGHRHLKGKVEETDPRSADYPTDYSTDYPTDYSTDYPTDYSTDYPPRATLNNQPNYFYGEEKHKKSVKRKWRLFSVMIVHVGAGRLFVFFFPVKVIWLII